MPTIQKVIEDKKNIKEPLLVLFQESKFPKTLKELVQVLRDESYIVSERSIEAAIKQLQSDGYDIKKVQGKDDRYCLVRTGAFENTSYYNVLGKIRLPCAFSSDWHVGSKGFSRIAFNKFQEDCEKEKIKDIVMAGDLLQGLGVYAEEAADVDDPSIDGQEDHLVSLLKEFSSSIEFHAVLGNHESKIKGKWMVGHDPLAVVSKRIPNFNYYGSIAKLQLERFNLLMMHGKGGVPYAVSYKIQKIQERLLEQPTILVMGHIHKLLVLPTLPNHYMIQSGTLQRENSWLIQSGVVSQIGWIILRNITKTTIEVKITTPETF